MLNVGRVGSSTGDGRRPGSGVDGEDGERGELPPPRRRSDEIGGVGGITTFMRCRPTPSK